MNTLRRKMKLLFFMLFSICSLIFTSCKEKVEETKKVIPNNRVSELVLTQIAETNLKIVAIAQKAQEGKIKNSTRIALQEIEKSHGQLKNNIRKIAKTNFIIIPNTLYDTSVLKNFISEISTKLYLEKIENSLHNELKQYQTISTTTQNIDLKNLAKTAIPIIQNNITIVKEELKLI